MRYLISQKDFATKVGTSPSNLSRDYVKKNLLPMEGKKLVMPDAEKIYHQIKGGIPPVRVEVFEPNESLPINTGDGKTMQDLLDAKVKKEDVLGDIHKISLQKLRGELLSVEEVTEQVVTVCENIRNSLINLPNKIAPTLEGLMAAEIQLKLDDEVNELLTDLYNLHKEYSNEEESIT